MIILQIDAWIYRWLIEAEMLIWMRYKIDPFTFEKNLSILDFQFYIQDLTRRVEEDNKQQNQNGNKLMKSLVAIRDILNYMTLPTN